MRKIAIAFAAILMAAAANAQTKSPGAFNAAFPCTVQKGADGTKSIAAWCANADGVFRVDVSVNQPGSSDQDAVKAVISAINQEIGAPPRLQREVTRNGLTGHDIVTDIPGQGFTERDQLWTINGFLYRVRFLGRTGKENSKTAADFLESFSTAP